MPTFETLRLRRPRPGAPVAPLTIAPVAPVAPAPVLLGTEGDRPPRDVDLTLLLPPLLNGKPTRNVSTKLFWLARIGSGLRLPKWLLLLKFTAFVMTPVNQSP